MCRRAIESLEEKNFLVAKRTLVIVCCLAARSSGAVASRREGGTEAGHFRSCATSLRCVFTAGAGGSYNEQ